MVRTSGHRASRWAFGAAALALSLAPGAFAQAFRQDLPEQMQGIALEPKLGDRVPMDVSLINTKGKPETLADSFAGKKPVVLALVYYSCPMMCPLILSRIQERINDLPYLAGEDYRLVVVSFDPNEKTELARGFEDAYVTGYRVPETPAVRSGIRFFTAPPGEAKRLADAIGFKYKFVPESGQYAHGSALAVLTGEGVVSRYVDGLAAERSELRLALLEASQGKIAKSLGDFFLHFCYRWDSTSGKYTLQAMRVMQIGGVLTMTGLGALVLTLRAGDRLRAARRAGVSVAAPALGGVTTT